VGSLSFRLVGLLHLSKLWQRLRGVVWQGLAEDAVIFGVDKNLDGISREDVPPRPNSDPIPTITTPK